MRLFFLFFLLFSTFFSVSGQESPQIRMVRTTTHEPVLKDSVWEPGTVVERVHICRYDYNGRVLATGYIEPNGEVHRKVVYRYDKQGRVYEELHIDKDGVSSIADFTYDDEGRTIELKISDAQRNPAAFYSKVYDSDGKVLMITSQLDVSENPIVSTIIYDSDRNPIRVDVISSFGKKTTRPLHKNDTIDLKQYPRKYNIRAEIIKEDGLKEGDLLTYDEHNNWIKRVRFKGEKPETIYVREIEYIENRSSLSGLLLNGKVKTVKQVSYIANPKPDGSILRGKKKGHFFDYTFDEEGYAKSENSYNEVGEPTGRVEFEYNEEKQIVKESYKQPDGKLLHTIEWNYTPEGNVKSKVMKDSQGEGLRKALYYYNLEYDCIKEVWYNRDGTIYHEVKSQYDAYGKCVFQEVTVSQQEDERCSTVMKWNFQGRKVEEKIYLPSGEEKASFTYRYSRTGECISGTEKEGAGDPVKILYKFYRDKANNWKMRIKHVDGVPTVYEERMYTYYN